MKKVIVLVCCLTFWAGKGEIVSADSAAAEKTISPYFFIQSEDSGSDSFPLKNTDVEVAVTGVIAEVTVRQTYANMGGEVIHGCYIFPGSTRAAVHGMKMVVGERVIEAVIKEKEQARETFENAKKQGKNASLLEQKRPNVFSMEVANIRPGDTVEIELRYTELLIPEKGTYEFVYPTVVGPRYSTLPDNQENLSESWVQNPYLIQGSEPETGFNISVFLSAGMKLQKVSCPTHDTQISYEDLTRARVELAQPVIFGGDRDYILQYRLADMAISSGLLLEQGEKENFFLLMVQPPEKVTQEIIVPREYSFVIDVSGSMHGFPLDTAKKLLEDLISSLRPTDSFNVLLFAGDSTVLSKAPVPASPENIDRAMKLITQSRGGGGTELLKAMQRAMDLPRQEGVARTLVIVTDGYINAEREVFAEIQENLDNTNVFAFGIGSSVNRFLIEGIARSGRGEPIIVTNPEQARASAQRFRDYVARPVLTDISVHYEGLEVFDIEPPAVPDLFGQRPVIVFGRFKGEPTGTIGISGRSGAGEFRQGFNLSEVSAEKITEGLGYLWARSRIARISDFSPRKAGPEERERIVELGLAYNLLTPFTSFVAVDEIVRNPDGQGRDVKQPLTLPKGVSNLAVSGGVADVPEPEFVFMVLLLLAALLIRYLQRFHQAKPAGRLS
ncbi:MAG: VIT and VWA domain-containing protein [Desulfocapsaceae bacterium]